jgi:sugar fermentation stimulation protein A
MTFEKPLVEGKLIHRYKRFLADIELNSGEIVTAYCPNSGSMKSCMTPGWKVMLSKNKNPKRKYQYTWEMIHNGICWIGINTHVPNQIVAEAISQNCIPELGGYNILKREVKYGKNSRIDIFLEYKNSCCYVEIKNVSLVEEDGNYYFPDSVTERGRKHLHELMEMKLLGHRTVMFYFVQRSDGNILKPAAHIDHDYTRSLKEAYAKGVEILVYKTDVSPQKIELNEKISCELD